MSKKQAHNENVTTLQKPKAVSIQKSDRAKTAPIDTDFNLEVIDNEGENSEYIKTYNYYIYYHSLKPRDPRLPKPLYKPKPDLEFIKRGLKLDGEILEQDEEKSIKTNSMGKNIVNTMPKIVEHDEFGDEYNLDFMMKNLNIGDKTTTGSSITGGNNAFSSYFDYVQNQSLNNSQFNMSNYNNYSQFQNNDLYDGMKPNKQLGNDMSYYYQQSSGFNMGKNSDGFDYGFYSGSDGFSQFNNRGYPQYGTSGKQGGMMNSMSMGNNNMNFMNNNNPMNMNNNYMNFNNNMINNQPYQTKGNYYQKNLNNNFNNNQNENSFNQYNQFISPSQNMGMPGGIMSNMNNMGNMNKINHINPNTNSYLIGNNYNNNNPPFTNKNNKNVMNMNKMQANNMNSMSMQNINNTGGMNNMNTINSSSNYSNNKQSNSKGFPFEIPSFNDILTNIISYSKDHSGSRLVQKKYEDANEIDRQQMFNILFPETYNLTKDVFGNYVIQKMLEYSSPDQRKLIIQELEGKIYELTVHMYGCRVIQKAIEVAEVEDVRKHLGELKNYIKTCIEDQNGNHVIQKLIEKLPQGEHKEIIRVIQGKTSELSTHQYGCRVIQRVFEYCSNDEKEMILKEIYERIIGLCLDQYGNYVIQHIIEKMGPSKISKIFNELRGKIFDLSIHKFASNVIEKCLTFGYPSQKNEIIGEVIMIDDQTNESLLALVKDKYGNYVVQKMIEFADDKTKEIIIKRIISSQALKKRDGFSKHVINFIEKMGFNANSLK